MKKPPVWAINLKALRIKKNWNQEGAAKAIGIKRSCYSKFERGEREPNLRVLMRICTVYQIIDVLSFLEREMVQNVPTTICKNPAA